MTSVCINWRGGRGLASETRFFYPNDLAVFSVHVHVPSSFISGMGVRLEQILVIVIVPQTPKVLSISFSEAVKVFYTLSLIINICIYTASHNP